MYHAQEGQLFCSNPRDDEGTLKVADCVEVRGKSQTEVAEILATGLNAVMKSKDKAEQKDELLGELYEYLLATDIDSVPRFVWDQINKAYQI